MSIDAPKPSNDGGFIAPDRSARALCWEGRDGFFACLNKNNIVDSVREADKANTLCSAENAAFEKNCATSWVSRACMREDKQRQRRLFGNLPGQRPDWLPARNGRKRKLEVAANTRSAGPILQEEKSDGIPERSDTEETGG